MQRKYVATALALTMLILALGCGGGDKATPTPIIVVVTPDSSQSDGADAIEAIQEPTLPPPAVEEPVEQPSSVEVSDVVFAHGLSEEMAPVDPGSDFNSTEPVYLSVELKGRPKGGEVIARFYWQDTFITDAAVDLADLNSGVIFSIGENTYVGYTLSHDDAWPVGTGYRADLFYSDEALGSYPFRIVPPDGAIPSQVKEVILAKGADENYNPIEPATTFAPGEAVHMVGRGDFGQESWLQADWFVGGQLYEAGTRSVTLEENIADTGFGFTFQPEAGWPAGEHFVVLTLDGEEVGRYPFTIDSSGAAPRDDAAL